MAATPVPPRRLVALLLLTAVVLMVVDGGDLGPAERAREVTLTVTRPARDAARWAARPLVDGWDGAVHGDDLEAENATLRARVAELEGRLDGAPDAQAELEEVLRATHLPFAGDLPRVTASVVSDRRTGLEHLVEIDRGSDDGVRVGMPVVTGTGLVGRLEVVTAGRSILRLVTDPRSSVGVRAVAGPIGVARGTGDGRALRLELPASGADAGPVGRRFRTSGSQGSQFPPGIPVGEVIGAPAPGGAELAPSADLDELHYLTVLLWEPDP